MASHYDIICPSCGLRIGGCRCPGPNKTKQMASSPCAICKQKAAEARTKEAL